MAVRPVRSDRITEEPNKCQMGPLKDGLWIKSCTEKGKKRRFGFNVSFQPANCPHGRLDSQLKKKARAVDSFRQTARGGVKREQL